MFPIDVNDFIDEKHCSYKDEKYSVRDNGAVIRHCRERKTPRPNDNIWTFGKPNMKTGYMEIASVRVHRIVAVAFHGEPPTPEHVVDHIDTNRRNNRPENLRWLTRLENALCNPITVKRIEFICGSVESFLKNPSQIQQGQLDHNFDWMRTVTREEAHACLARMTEWVKSDKPASGGSLGNWLFNPLPVQIKPLDPTIEDKTYIMAITPNAAQRDWRTPTEFPNCPQGQTDNPIGSYYRSLTEGVTFSKNEYTEAIVYQTAISEAQKILWVASSHEEAIKPWSLAQVTYEDDLFVHTSLGTFFAEDGVKKALCEAQGMEWTGPDSIDDYC